MSKKIIKKAERTAKKTTPQEPAATIDFTKCKSLFQPDGKWLPAYPGTKEPLKGKDLSAYMEWSGAKMNRCPLEVHAKFLEFEKALVAEIQKTFLCDDESGYWPLKDVIEVFCRLMHIRDSFFVENTQDVPSGCVTRRTIPQAIHEWACAACDDDKLPHRTRDGVTLVHPSIFLHYAQEGGAWGFIAPFARVLESLELPTDKPKPKRLSENEEAMLKAAQDCLDKWPQDCRNRQGHYSGDAILRGICEHAETWWPCEKQPPIKSERVARLFNKALKKENLRVLASPKPKERF